MQRNCGLRLVKKIEFINEINSLKTLAQLGEGGPLQWWVRDQFVWELEKMNQSETQKTFARKLRSEQTEVEQQLWRALRNRVCKESSFVVSIQCLPTSWTSIVTLPSWRLN